MRRTVILVSCAVAALAAWGFVRQGGERAAATESHQAMTASAPSGAAATAQLRVEVPPPPFSEGVFPCSECHNATDLPPNRTRRTLVDAHDEIVLKHDEEHRWCLDCHDTSNRDRLHLASGELVSFEESYRICGQCHGEKYRDWRAGVHGRRIGEWNGAKQYLLCVHCHSPHQPRFKSLAPRRAPLPPIRGVR
jgi:hypothetical protein